jgi:uncharacterized protein
MESDRIGLKTLALAMAVILAVEYLRYAARFLGLGPHLSTIGVARLAEILGLVLVVSTFGGGLRDLGLEGRRLKQGVKTGLLWSAAFGLCAALGLLVLAALGMPPGQMLGGRMPSEISELILLMLVGGVLAPVAEEMFFRGVLYGFLRRWGALLALIVSTLAFVLAHRPGAGPPPLPQALGGLVFCLAYEKTGNLLVPIIIHVLGNLAIFTLLIWFNPGL